MTSRLLLVRHGLTAWNSEGRFQGHQDPPLSPDGVAEARLLAARIAAEQDVPARVVSSPLSRARQTAEALVAALEASGHHVTMQLDERLMEIGQGEWEGRTHAELAVQDAERYAAWRAHAGAEQPPGGETAEDALARIGAMLQELAAAESPTRVCLVSHGGILRLAARHLLELEMRRAWAMDVDNASLSVLTRAAEGPWRLDLWNDASHLLGRAPMHVDEAEGEPLAL